MQSDGEKLKYFRQKLGLKQTPFAKSLGVSQAAIANIESGCRRVSPAVSLALLKKYGWDFDEDKIDDLIHERDKGLGINPDLDIKNAEDYGFKKEKDGYVQKTNPNCVPIPFYDVKAAAGSGIALPDYPDKDVIYFDTRWLKNIIGINPENASIITARGDSMDSGQNKLGDIRDGDLLMVDNSIREVINNQIFVVNIGSNELVVKRMIKEWDGKVELCSNNPKYPNIIPTESAIIVGKVVWNGSKENI